MLSVADSGTGMSPEVIERAFDPFFTTKEAGKGTGLGLSMAYGFAKQSRGHLKIYSEVGHGTSIRLYLPCADALDIEPGSTEDDTDAAIRRGDGETILLVEDEAAVRAVAETQLSRLGYRVLVADGPQQARRILESDAHIDLLFTDLVMPGGVSGRELAAEARMTKEGVRVLYTSGYSRHAVENVETLRADMHFLAKPYRAKDLAAMVRRVLDAPE